MQMYDNGAASSFPGPNGVVDLRLDNVKFVTTPTAALRRVFCGLGTIFRLRSASEVRFNSPRADQTAKSFAFGDSYGTGSLTNFVDHTQSTLFPTDGAHSMRLSQPLATNTAAGTFARRHRPCFV